MSGRCRRRERKNRLLAKPKVTIFAALENTSARVRERKKDKSIDIVIISSNSSNDKNTKMAELRSSMPDELQEKLEGRRSLRRQRSRKKNRRNLLPAFNAATAKTSDSENKENEYENWVVIDLDQNEKKQALRQESPLSLFDAIAERQERAALKREQLLSKKVYRAKEMTELRVNVGGAKQKSPGLDKIDEAAMRKDLFLYDRVLKAKHLARLRTPRKKRSSRVLTSKCIETKQQAAEERRNQVLSERIRRAGELGNRKSSSTAKDENSKTEKERRQFKLDELNARLQAAEERRGAYLSGRRKRANELGDNEVLCSLKNRRQFLSDLLNYKLEAAAARRGSFLVSRARRAAELGEGNVLFWIARKRQFMADVLNARLEAAEERRSFVLECRKRIARSLGDNNLAKALAFEQKAMQKALTNLWHLKLEAASARRNIGMIQRKRRAYELGDEIVRANVEVRNMNKAFALASKLKSAEQRRSAGLEDRVRRARKLGDYEVKERRKALKLEKANMLAKKLQAAEAKRKEHLCSKSKRAEELGTERVEKTHYNAIMSACIQAAAGVGKLKGAETRRNKNLFTLQTRAGRNNARAAAIANIHEQRLLQEKEIAQRYINFKMARAEMNRDVMKLLRCGLHGNPTFTLVKPIAFIV